MLLLGRTREETVRAKDTVIYLLQHLGFVINLKKSVLEPTQKIEFLGLIVNSQDLSLSLTQEKLQKVKTRCLEMYKAETVSILELTKLIGLLCSTTQAVLPAQLQLRYLQKLQIKALQKNQCYHHQVVLDADSKQELMWWIQNLTICNGRCLVQTQPQIIIQTDASKTGWGASCQGMTTRGVWSNQEKELHINVLELLAVKLALLSFMKDRVVKSIHFQIDNTTAIRYLAKMGGTHNSVLLKLSKEIWKFLLERGITITTEYLPSKLNVIADRESRARIDSSEWKMCPKVFSQVCQKLGTPQIDLFASRLTHQLPRYMAWRPDPYSQGTDAMQQIWPQGFLYAFPPFCLINRVLQKVCREKISEIIIVTPTWHTQPWYPQLLEMSIERPLLLPKQNNLLKDPLGRVHPLIANRTLRLAAWKVSGKDYLCQEFQEQLPNLSLVLEDIHHQTIMNRPGESGLAGVVKNKLIQFIVM